MNESHIVSGPTSKGFGSLLWVLFALFCLRVLGQILVAIWGVPFLPPMEEWFSGAIPYPLLLTAQVLIIGLLAVVCRQFTQGSGWFVRPNRKLGSGLVWFGSIYLVVMIIRYTVRMSLYPPERWTGGSIPIFFHWVLASYLLTVARFHLLQSPASPRSRRRWLRGLSVTLIAVSLVVWVAYLFAPAVMANKLGFGPPRFAVRIDRGVAMRSSDGIELVADIYRPLRAGSVPTILVRLPYSKTVQNRLVATLVGRMWAEHGYNVVMQGVRGRYESGGTFTPLVGERQDGIDTLHWLVKQPWFDGRLGMWGGSYFGYTQWVLADQVDPGPSALMVQISSTSFYDMLYPGGAFALESGLYWALHSGGTEEVPVSAEDLDRGYGHLPLIDADSRASRDVGFFNDWVSHPTRDAFWEAIDGNRRWATIQSPILLMAGWFDPFLPSQLTDFVQIRAAAPAKVAANTRLIIGPWAHAWSPDLPDGYQGDNYRLASLAPSLPWFDRHLKGDRSIAPLAPVRLFVQGENVWRDEQEWPLARAVYTPYYLCEEGGKPSQLQRVPPTKSHGFRYRFDPVNPVPSSGGAMLGPRAGPRAQDLRPRDDVLSFVTPALDQDMEITGPVKATLYVHTTARCTDFTVLLMDVHPTGQAYNISEGILRRTYRAGTRSRIDVSMWPTSIVIRKGHAMRVQVSSSSYPRFDVNPNTGRSIASEATPVMANQTLFVGGETASFIVLPVIPR